MLELVGNPNCWFSNAKAHILSISGVSYYHNQISNANIMSLGIKGMKYM